jgi:nitric oxide reductase subunit B
MGLEFLAVQKELEVHFVGLILAALLFTVGAVALIYNFIRYGLPRGDAKFVASNTNDGFEKAVGA